MCYMCSNKVCVDSFVEMQVKRKAPSKIKEVMRSKDSFYSAVIVYLSTWSFSREREREYLPTMVYLGCHSGHSTVYSRINTQSGGEIIFIGFRSICSWHAWQIVICIVYRRYSKKEKKTKEARKLRGGGSLFFIFSCRNSPDSFSAHLDDEGNTI